MGKIKIKTIGDETVEEQEKTKEKVKKEQKKAREKSTDDSPRDEAGTLQTTVPVTTEPKSPKSSKKKKPAKARPRSKKYLEVKMLVDTSKKYSVKEALELLPKLKMSKFDETVELHINTTEQGVSGNLTLPHGTGKQTKVAVADDQLIAAIEKGKIDFDILVAEPQMMPKLAKVAKVLGPRGLMPNPKNGTITTTPQEVVKKFEAGQIRFKTEAKAPVIHLSVGKLSFGDKKLSENIEMVIKTVGTGKIKSVVLKSTMSPAIRLQVQ